MKDNKESSKKKLKKIKTKGEPLSNGRAWVTAQLEASHLKQEEETGNEAKSPQVKGLKEDHSKENLSNVNKSHNYPLFPKDE